MIIPLIAVLWLINQSFSNLNPEKYLKNIFLDFYILNDFFLMFVIDFLKDTF